MHQPVLTSMQGKATLKKDLLVEDSEVVIADVVKDNITEAMKGCSALICVTSAKPELVWSSMPGFFWKRFVQKEEGIMPGFTFAQMPEQVRFCYLAAFHACFTHEQTSHTFRVAGTWMYIITDLR